MRSLTAFLMFVCHASFASAAPDTTRTALEQYPTYTAGTYALTLNAIGLGYGTAQGFFMAVSPRAEVFALDRLAVGVQSEFSTTAFSSSGTYFSIGPAATYHFWSDKHWSAYGGAAFVFNHLNQPSTASRTLQLSLGGNYNFSKWFGIGPRVGLNTEFTSDAVSSSVVLNYINLFFYF